MGKVPSRALTPLPILTRSATNPFPPPVVKSRSLGLPFPSLLFCPQSPRGHSCGEWARTAWRGAGAMRVRAADSRHLLLPLLKAEIGVFISFPSPVTQPAQVALIWGLVVWHLVFTSGRSEAAVQMDNSYLQKIHLYSRPLGVCAGTASWGPARTSYEGTRCPRQPPQSCRVSGGVGKGSAQMQDTPNASISSAEAKRSSHSQLLELTHWCQLD